MLKNKNYKLLETINHFYSIQIFGSREINKWF